MSRKILGFFFQFTKIAWRAAFKIRMFFFKLGDKRTFSSISLNVNNINSWSSDLKSKPATILQSREPTKSWWHVFVSHKYIHYASFCLFQTRHQFEDRKVSLCRKCHIFSVDRASVFSIWHREKKEWPRHASLPFFHSPQRYLSARWVSFHAVYTERKKNWCKRMHTYVE